MRIPTFGCCIIAIFSAWTLHAATPGSNRPGVQENFQQLIENRGCPGCNLAGAILNRVDLSGVNLEGANLAGAKLYLADLSNANLRGANLQGAALGGADLAGADLREANLTGAILEGAYFEGARTDGIITNLPAEAAGGIAGERVFIADESRSKHTPYSQEVVIEKRRDLNSTAPGSIPQGSGEVTGETDVGENGTQDAAVLLRSKQPVPMADVVVPEPVETPRGSDQNEVDQAVILEDNSKQEVASSPEAATGPQTGAAEDVVDTVDERGKKTASTEDEKPVIFTEAVSGEEPAPADGLDEHSPVHAMIAQIEADNTSIGKSPAVEGRRHAERNVIDSQSSLSHDIADSAAVGPALKRRSSAQSRQKVPENTPEVQEVKPAAEPEPVVQQQPAQESVREAPISVVADEPPAAVSSSVDNRSPEKQEVTAAVQSDPVDHQGRKQGSADEQQAAETAPETGRDVERPVDNPVAGEVENNVPGPKAAGSGLMYTVETPETAEAKQQVLIDRLLDDDRCVECDLAGVDLSGKRLKEVDLERANLQGADLEGVNLSGANLKGANLSGANLKNADLSGADLYRANLSGADLSGADFSETLIDSADFSGAAGVSLTGAVQSD